jgi:uncharacterized C2H2 Zn-finger protein
MKPLLATLVILALAGCGAAQKPADTAAQTPPPAAAPSGADAAVAAVPHQIQELTDQTLIYECPKCGMMFDAAGVCTMDGSELVATQVAYTCPKDNQPVAKAGQCPRCPMNARVEKTAMAAGTTPTQH